MFAFYVQDHERTAHATTHRNTCFLQAAMATMFDTSPQYEYRLIPMSSARSRAGAPGEMIDWYKLPADDEGHEIMFSYLNGVTSFVDFTNEDKTLKPEGTIGWFCESHSSGFATSRRT
jgi:hypothetical protein